MDSDDTPSGLDPIQKLTEEYLKRIRRGEHPTPADYAARYPELAVRILELFPALELLEGLKPIPEDHALPRDGRGHAGRALPLERLWGRARSLGDYTLLREVGRGGMGIVYEAEHESLKNRVALKVMHPRLRRGPDLSAAVPDRGPLGRAAAPYQHRAGLRLWRAGRGLLLRDAAHRRSRARASDGRRPPTSRGGRSRTPRP